MEEEEEEETKEEEEEEDTTNSSSSKKKYPLLLMEGKEGEIMRKLLPVICLLLLSVSVMTFLAVLFS